MTTLEITGLPRYIAWADGFLPPTKDLHGILLPEFKNELKIDPTKADDFYVKTLKRAMQAKHPTALSHKPDSFHSDIYIIAPSRNPSFPHQYNPVHDELSTLKDRLEDYRLLCVVHSHEETDPWRGALTDSLRELMFEIRPDNTYMNLQRFKDFLSDLSYNSVVVPYFAPSISVAKDLELLGFSTESETIL